MINLKEQLTEGSVEKFLKKFRINKSEGHTFYDCYCGCMIEVTLTGNTFKHLIDWLIEHRFEKGKYYGEKAGILKAQEEIQKALGLK